jgi:hypothetical protein
MDDDIDGLEDFDKEGVNDLARDNKVSTIYSRRLCSHPVRPPIRTSLPADSWCSRAAGPGGHPQ